MGWTDGVSVEDKLQKKILYDAAKAKKKSDKEKKAKKKEQALASIEWQTAKLEFANFEKEAIGKLKNIKLDYWEDWNKQRINLKHQQAKADEIEKKKTAHDKKRDAELTDTLNGLTPGITAYMDAAEKGDPEFFKQLDFEQIQQHILTMADDEFSKAAALQMKLAKALGKLKAFSLDQQFDTNIIQQKLADIPLMIEEKIDMIKGILDGLLGKLALPALNPDLPEFDLDVIIAQIKALLNPVIATTMPLTAVVGNIPILGDLLGLLSMMNGGSSSGLTKEQIWEMVPKPPSLDPTIQNKIFAILDDIKMFLMTLPTILIQIIFAMINVIYSKLKIITSVIPLGGMFPLNLVDAAIAAGPKILDLIKQLPGMVMDLLMGVVRQKFQEAMALAIPIPNLDVGSLNALSEEVKDDIEAKKSKAKAKKDYNDISLEVFTNQLSAVGYTLPQVKKIQKNYKEIFNGSDVELTKYVDDGEQDLPNLTTNSLGNLGASLLNSFTSTATLGFSGTNLNAEEEADESNLKYGVKKADDPIKRSKATPEAYGEYLNGLIASAAASEDGLSGGLKYDKLVKVKPLVGEWYELYKEQVLPYGQQVVIEDKLTPKAWYNPMPL